MTRPKLYLRRREEGGELTDAQKYETALANYRASWRENQIMPTEEEQIAEQIAQQTDETSAILPPTSAPLHYTEERVNAHNNADMSDYRAVYDGSNNNTDDRMSGGPLHLSDYQNRTPVEGFGKLLGKLAPLALPGSGILRSAGGNFVDKLNSWNNTSNLPTLADNDRRNFYEDKLVQGFSQNEAFQALAVQSDGVIRYADGTTVTLVDFVPGIGGKLIDKNGKEHTIDVYGVSAASGTKKYRDALAAQTAKEKKSIKLNQAGNSEDGDNYNSGNHITQPNDRDRSQEREYNVPKKGTGSSGPGGRYG